MGGTAGEGAGGTAAETDEHGRAAEDDEVVAGIDGGFFDVFGADVAEAAGEHNGFVITAELGAAGVGHLLFEGAEVAVDGGPAEFVVEGGGAERAFEHDVEGGDDAGRFAEIFFPWPDGSGDFQI